MKTSVERFINRENIKNFRKRLDQGLVDDAQRETLLALLAEEEAKAEQLARQAENDDEPDSTPLTNRRSC
jgi:hypothetical protein